MISDVVIIGGGVIGLCIARELHKQGATRIRVVEKGVCGEESSWAAGGMLGPQAEADERSAFFELCSASRDLYPTLAAELLEETRIDIELDRSGTLCLAFTEDDVGEIERRFNWQRRAGLPIEQVSAEAARSTEPLIAPDVRAALFFPTDWQVENRRLIAALRRYAEINGIEIIENTPVQRLIVESGRVIGAETEAGSIFAGENVLATGAWTSLIKLGHANFPVKVEPVRGQMICYRTDPGLFKHVIYSPRGYIVPRTDGRILAGSTSENVGFTKAVTSEAAESLQKMAAEISPFLDGLPIVDSWSGLHQFAADGLPVLGGIDNIDGLFVATAHYRNGILLPPLTARLAAERLIHGKDSEYFRTFGIGRFPLCGVGVGM